MNQYILATSSTCDLSKEYLEEHDIPYISYTYTNGDQVFVDDCSEESRTIAYKAMREGSLLKTSMINEFLYQEFFRDLLETGKDVLFVDMSKEISASFSNAVKAAEEIRKEYPDQKLYLIDTCCVSGGLGILVENLVEMKEAGASFDELVSWGEENKLKIAHRFTVDDLKYLQISGRVSNASALAGTLLSIKPIMYVPDRGTLDVVKKVRGRKAAIRSIQDSIVDDLKRVDQTKTKVRILNVDCPEDAEVLRAGIIEKCPDLAEVKIASLGVVISAHVGPGLLAIFYLCDGRRP